MKWLQIIALRSLSNGDAGFLKMNILNDAAAGRPAS
jgi:hypothetical protein